MSRNIKFKNPSDSKYKNIISRSATWTTEYTSLCDSRGVSLKIIDGRVWTADNKALVNYLGSLVTEGSNVTSFAPYTTAEAVQGVKIYSKSDSTLVPVSINNPVLGETWYQYITRQSGQYIVTPSGNYLKAGGQTDDLKVVNSTSSSTIIGCLVAGTTSGTTVKGSDSFSKTVTNYYEVIYDKFTIDGSAVGLTTLSNQNIPADNSWANYVGSGKAFGSGYQLQIDNNSGCVVVVATSNNRPWRAIKYNGSIVKGTDTIIKDTTYTINQAAFTIGYSASGHRETYFFECTTSSSTKTFYQWWNVTPKPTYNGSAITYNGGYFYAGIQKIVDTGVPVTTNEVIRIGWAYDLADPVTRIGVLDWSGEGDPNEGYVEFSSDDVSKTWTTLVSETGGTGIQINGLSDPWVITIHPDSNCIRAENVDTMVWKLLKTGPIPEDGNNISATTTPAATYAISQYISFRE